MTKKRGMIFLNILVILITIFYLVPSLWLLISSFKEPSELFTKNLQIFPKKFSFENYVIAFEKMNFLKYIGNTMFVAVSATLLTLAISSMAGYALAKFRYKFMTFIFLLLLTMQMLPTEIIMKPTFDVIRSLGLYNSFAGIILPTINTMTGIFLMRQFFITVPDSIAESARIEGAGEFTIFRKLMLPLAATPLAILTIFSFQWRWNDYIWPLIVISDPDKYTLQLMLSNLMGQFYIDWTIVIPASVMTLIPTLIIFLIFQRKIMEGLANSGSKES